MFCIKDTQTGRRPRAPRPLPPPQRLYAANVRIRLGKKRDDDREVVFGYRDAHTARSMFIYIYIYIYRPPPPQRSRAANVRIKTSKLRKKLPEDKQVVFCIRDAQTARRPRAPPG